jgi:hypothetical protein
VKRRLWLVNQVTTDASLPTVRICRLFYRSDAIQIHLILYLLIDYVYRHSIVQYSLLVVSCAWRTVLVSLHCTCPNIGASTAADPSRLGTPALVRVRGGRGPARCGQDHRCPNKTLGTDSLRVVSDLPAAPDS